MRKAGIRSKYGRRSGVWQTWALAACLLAACSATETKSGDGPPVASTQAPTPPVYVAVGASDTWGFGADKPLVEGWPQVLHREHLSPGTRLVVVGVPGATVSTALTGQLPRAMAESPTLVTVWLGVNDLLRGVPANSYENQLRQLVQGLRRGGSTTVLLGNTPPPALLPRSISAETVQAYNAAIDRISRQEGAVLVDLYRAGIEASRGQQARLIASDGFHPSTAGHRAIAEAFSRALPRVAQR